jgi:hypothetical protein
MWQCTSSDSLALADGLYEPVDGIGRERRTALGSEHVTVVREFPAQCGQHAELVAADGMDRWLAILDPPHMQRGRSTEFDL